MRLRHHLLLAPILLTLLGSTCVIVEEGPDEGNPYGEQSREERMEEDEAEEVITDSER